MKFINKHVYTEYLIYFIVWVVIFCFPFADQFFDSEVSSIDWTNVTQSWFFTLPVFVLFLLNNFLLIPKLLFKNRPVSYVITVLAITFVVLFGVRHLLDLPQFSQLKPPAREEMREVRNFWRENRLPEFEKEDSLTNEESALLHRIIERKAKHEKKKDFRLPPRGDIFSPAFARYVMAFLILAFNASMRLFFRSLKRDDKVKELEKQHLKSELEYLKYQINPHFFMNTLNNIHALIDIDKGKAQETILELSKMMRYVLYEAYNNLVPLEREVIFLQNYIELMRLRYTDIVRVNMNVPSVVPKVEIPPLLFITFVENAFKHGVSYRRESLIDISIEMIDNRVNFTCINTLNKEKSETDKSGIGIENAKKRLGLLYGSDYTLNIECKENSFYVNLIIPAV